jgi:hypothetical protein
MSKSDLEMLVKTSEVAEQYHSLVAAAASRVAGPKDGCH